MNLTKDVYEYLLNFADDKAIINMLSVNRKFNDEKLFERIILRKYPYLIEQKPKSMTWRQFFVQMVYYISKLKEEHGIPYIDIKNYNPKNFYKTYGKSVFAIYSALELAILEKASYGVVQEMLDVLREKSPELKINYIATLDDLLDPAVESGDLSMVKLLIYNGATDFEDILTNAAFFGYLDIAQYAMENRDKIKGDIIEDAVILSMNYKHPEVENYLRTFL